MRRFLRLEAVVVVGLWVPGLVFSCLAEGRRKILFEVEGSVLLPRAAVEGDKPDFEVLLEDFLPFTADLTAIAQVCRFWAGLPLDRFGGQRYGSTACLRT